MRKILYVILLRVNTTCFKGRLARKLGVKSGDPGAMYFYADYTEDYAAHLIAEQINDKGVWENPRGRANHLWDCEVMAMAAETYLHVQTVASRMKCNDKTVYRLIQEVKLPAVGIGGRALRIPASTFNDYLKSRVVDPDESIIMDR